MRDYSEKKKEKRKENTPRTPSRPFIVLSLLQYCIESDVSSKFFTTIIPCIASFVSFISAPLNVVLETFLFFSSTY